MSVKIIFAICLIKFPMTKNRVMIANELSDVRIGRKKGMKMATTVDFIEYVCEQIRGTGFVRYKKMFGEYMVYVNDKPVLLVCDNIVFVKTLDCIADKLKNAEMGVPYTGAKEHYILDIDDGELSKDIVQILEPVTPLPRPRKKKL